jgi:hypothetical protein
MKLRRAFSLITAAGALAGLCLWAVGWALSRPVNHPVAMPEATGFKAVLAGTTHGSLLRVPGATRCVLLMHGIRGPLSPLTCRHTAKRRAR